MKSNALETRIEDKVDLSGKIRFIASFSVNTWLIPLCLLFLLPLYLSQFTPIYYSSFRRHHKDCMQQSGKKPKQKVLSATCILEHLILTWLFGWFFTSKQLFCSRFSLQSQGFKTISFFFLNCIHFTSVICLNNLYSLSFNTFLQKSCWRIKTCVKKRSKMVPSSYFNNAESKATL